MDDSASNLIDNLVGAAIFAVAISMIIFMNRLLSENVAYAAKNIDEKQSIELADGRVITDEVTTETAATAPEEITYTASQVLSTIMSVDPEVTRVTVNGMAIPKETIKAAEDGDERGIFEISDVLRNDLYVIRNVYDTGSDGDYLYELAFIKY